MRNKNPTPQTHKKFEDVYCAVELSVNRRQVTKYRSIDMCGTGQVRDVQRSQKSIYYVSLKHVEKIC
jgi:hypothetical protein